MERTPCVDTAPLFPDCALDRGEARACFPVSAQVSRIHNRFLRNRFEDHLANFMDPTDAVAKRALEYLFFGDDPEMPGTVLRALQYPESPSEGNARDPCLVLGPHWTGD